MDSVEQDDHNFSASSSHRLPTVSGTEAIRNARRNAQPIPISVAQLESILGEAASFGLATTGGVQRGSITEIFGPPGVGKTTLALQVAVNALHLSDKSAVIWIDTSSSLVWSRLEQLLEGYRLSSDEQDLPSSPPIPQHSNHVSLTDRFSHLEVTTLPKLLTLFLHPTPSFPPPNTELVVLDDLSSLILSSLPHTARSASTKASQRPTSSVRDAELSKRALSRRFQVLSSFASALQKFAATNNVAVLVTSKAAVNLKAGQRAVLRPALSSQQWDHHLSIRIALYRDFWPEESTTSRQDDGTDGVAHTPTEHERRTLRYAKVVRLDGKSVSSPEAGFVIEERGLRDVTTNPNQTQTTTTVLPLSTQPLQPLEEMLDADDDDESGRDEHTAQTKQTEHTVDAQPGTSKRKAIEIADSDDDDDDNDRQGESSDDGISLPPAPASPEKVEFKPSSQIVRSDNHGKQGVSATGTREGTKKACGGSDQEEEVEEEEMLLESYEREVPPFSQAAAEMSQPLTPSDDERDIS